MASRTNALLLFSLCVMNVGPCFAEDSSSASADLLKTTSRKTDRISTYAKIIRYEDERHVDAEVLDLLKSQDPDLKGRAILALGRIGKAASVAPLENIIDSNDPPALKELAAFSLGEIESETAVSFILGHIENHSTSGELKSRLVEALGKIAANKSSAAALDKKTLDQMAKSVVESLQVYPKAQDAKLDESTRLNLIALTALLRMKQPSTIPSIIDALKSPVADVCWQSANVLARMKDGIGAAAPGLMMLLDDNKAIVRCNAARALGVAKEKSAVQNLIQLLKDDDATVVNSAIVALGNIGESKAVEPLLAIGKTMLAEYKNADREKFGIPERQTSLLLLATALGNIKDKQALPFLQEFRVADKHLGANPEVEIAVAKFGEAAFFDVPADITLDNNRWQSISAYAQGLGELNCARSKKTLLELLASKPDPRALSDILNALAALKVENLESILLEQLKADDVIVRATAVSLLADSGNASDLVLAALKQAYSRGLADKMNDARIAIVEATAKLKHPISRDILLGKDRDPDYIVRKRAVEVLREAGENVSDLDIGIVNTNHDDAYYQRVATLALGGNPEAIIYTKKGKIEVELLAHDAPMTVDNFIQLAKEGFFNGLTFMRVVPNFVIQGGDPRNDMNGGPGYQIRCEINLRQYTTGTLGMALSGKDTGGSQFFVTHAPQPHLDGSYTVFAQVHGALNAVKRIARGDLIQKVEIVQH